MSAVATEAPLAACRAVSVVYGPVAALRDVDLEISPAESVALWGRSGSGKTTLLHALGGLVRPTTGVVEWRSQPLAEHEHEPRARGIAYVFQSANLLPHFTAFENVAFAQHAARVSGRSPAELLELVGLGAHVDALPSELSGGEAQRVAIARALAKEPALMLCDEPTGQLDSDTGQRVLDLIDALRGEIGFALVVATHDADVAARYDRVVQMADGRVVGEEAAA